MHETKHCYMCDNARVNPELSEDSDLSCISVGHMDDGYRMLLCAGDGKPPRIEVSRRTERGWVDIGYYIVAYCPNCGCHITEFGVTCHHRALKGYCSLHSSEDVWKPCVEGPCPDMTD